MRFGLLTTIIASGLLAAGSQASAQPLAGGAVSFSNLSGPDYVKYAADMNNFEVQSGRLAASRAMREDVKGFAKQVAADHDTQNKALMAALNNQDRRITPPSMKLSSQNQSKLDLLRKAPRKGFDALYIQQQQEAHRSALDLQQAYAASGTDPSLKQVATAAIPVLQGHQATINGLETAAR